MPRRPKQIHSGGPGFPLNRPPAEGGPQHSRLWERQTAAHGVLPPTHVGTPFGDAPRPEFADVHATYWSAIATGGNGYHEQARRREPEPMDWEPDTSNAHTWSAPLRDTAVPLVGGHDPHMHTSTDVNAFWSALTRQFHREETANAHAHLEQSKTRWKAF